MKITTNRCAVLVLAGMAALAVPMQAQQAQPDKHAQVDINKGAPPFKAAPGVLGVLQKSSLSMGMLRRVVPSNLAVGGMLFIANGTMAEPGQGGTWTEYKVPKVQVEMTFFPYRQGLLVHPGARWDFSLVDAGGKMQRKILVAAGNAAWDEATPGGTATPMPNAAAFRLAENQMFPHGFLWAVLSADGKSAKEGVRTAEAGGKTVVTYSVNGVPAKATLDANFRPEKIETTVKHPILGDTPVEFEYSNYKDIEYGYDVMFPEHIVEKIGGHVALDLTVTEFHTNAYVEFPPPANVGQTAK